METDFWKLHGWWFIFFMCCFPRLTMLFATVAGGGFWYWLGWLFTPRLTVAILATYYFGHTNIVLVVFSWLWALCGENCEKAAIYKSNTKT